MFVSFSQRPQLMIHSGCVTVQERCDEQNTRVDSLQLTRWEKDCLPGECYGTLWAMWTCSVRSREREMATHLVMVQSLCRGNCGSPDVYLGSRQKMVNVW